METIGDDAGTIYRNEICHSRSSLKWAVIYQTGAFKKLKVDGPQPFIFTQQLLTVLVQFS